MSLPGAISITSNVRSRFYLRLALWVLCYLFIMVAWGERNSWPGEMIVPILTVPALLLMGRNIYRRHGLDLATREQEPQWELLISYLLMAIGMASGLMLLMAIGWISIGVTLLRPSQTGVPWGEWFKLPFLAIFTLPILTDLAGSRHDWLDYLVRDVDDPANWQNFLGTQVIARIGFFLLAARVTGLTFWGCLAVFLPGLIVAQKLSQRLYFPEHTWKFYTLFGVVCLALWLAVRHSLIKQAGIWKIIFDRLLNRSQSPWLAGLVIATQQSALIERWLAGTQPKLEIIGAAFMLVLLIRLRAQADRCAVAVQSQILLAGALFVLLGAEWTDLNFLRQVALGLLLVSLLSWNRNWSRWVMSTAMFSWLMALPATVAALTHFNVPPDAAGRWRTVLLCAGLGALGGAILTRPVAQSPKEYSDFAWLPAKRFALILLLLLTGFQIASVHWPNTLPAVSIRETVTLNAQSHVPLVFHSSAAEQRSYPLAGSTADLFAARPLEQPVRLQSPELVLKGSGWRIITRRLRSHTHGQVIELTIERNGKRGSALCWFQWGNQTFTHYLRARNILWSGWNLNHRDLEQVILLAEGMRDPAALTQLAESRNWFYADLAALETLPATTTP